MIVCAVAAETHVVVSVRDVRIAFMRRSLMLADAIDADGRTRPFELAAVESVRVIAIEPFL